MRRPRVPSIVVALLVAAACAETPPVATPTPAPVVEVPPTPRAPIDPNAPAFHGRAVLADGRPAVGARVRAFDLFAKGDAPSRLGDECVVGDDGAFRIAATGDDARAVVYGVLPHCAYASASVAPADDAVLTFVAGGVVEGTLTDADGRPMADAEVRVVRCDAKGRMRTSPARGIWARTDVAAFVSPTTRTDAGGRFHVDAAPQPDVAVIALFEDAGGRRWRSDVARLAGPGAGVDLDVRVGCGLTDEPDPLHRVDGRVVDADGRPVVGAQVVYGDFADDPLWRGERRETLTDDEGGFSVDLGDLFDSTGRRVELRVRLPGFPAWRGRPTPGRPVEIRLAARTPALRPGRIVGTALEADGSPMRGVVEISTLDEMLEWRRQSVLPDDEGRFILEGLWPGPWRLSIDWFSNHAEVEIGDGEEKRLTLRATQGSSPRGRSDDESRRILISRLQRASAKRAVDPSDEEARFDFDHSKAALAAMDDKRLRRVVVVNGVPSDAAVLQAECVYATWRVETHDGVARFPSLAVGRWKLRPDRVGVLGDPREFDVVPGDGEQTIDFPR